MAYLIEVCSSCGKKVNMCVSQTCRQGRADTHASYCCKDCGNQTEIDWIGEKPEDRIIEAIKEQDGVWSLEIMDGDKDRIIIMKTLKNELNLGMNKLKDILNDFQNLRLQGTRAEIEKIAFALLKAGIDTYIERVK